MSRKDRKPWWILEYSKRKNVSRKYRSTEKEISQQKLLGNWKKVKRLKYLLRNVWWGIKRYK
tara:strand:+ start:9192 stop:9377 length:186 start_codon:yes stop_codon:yes gene_type:complete